MNVHTKWNCLIPILSTLVKYCFRPENVNYELPILQVIKTPPYLDYFQTNNYSKTKTNIRLWMYTPNGTVWYPFCLLWLSITCFRPENVSYKLLIHTSGKFTTVVNLQPHLDGGMKVQSSFDRIVRMRKCLTGKIEVWRLYHSASCEVEDEW